MSRGTPDALGLVVADLERSVRFYRRLGAPFPEGAEHSEHGHAEAVRVGGFRLMLDTEASVRSFDPGWTAPAGEPRASLAFRCGTPAEVDDLFATAGSAHKGNDEDEQSARGHRPSRGRQRSLDRGPHRGHADGP